MRGLARIGCMLAGLAMCAPAVALAGVPQQEAEQAKQQARKAKAKVAKAARKLCAACQYRALLAKGVKVAAPDALPMGEPVKGQTCTACGAPTAVVFHGKTYRTPILPATAGVTAGAIMASRAFKEAPGRAVAGGEPAPAPAAGPASAMAFTGEPAPIGLATTHYGPSGPSAPMGMPMGMEALAATRPQGTPPAGLRDSAVQTTAMASEPIAPAIGTRPHIISHLLGFADVGREWSIRRENALEEQHAKIPYGMPGNPVTEVPASMVYGRGGLFAN